MNQLEKIALLVRLYKKCPENSSYRKAYIYQIAAKHEIAFPAIDLLFQENTMMDMPNFSLYTQEEKFEVLYHMIQFIKLDKKINSKELSFCKEICGCMGYNPVLVMELSCFIYSNAHICTKRYILRKMAKYHTINLNPRN